MAENQKEIVEEGSLEPAAEPEALAEAPEKQDPAEEPTAETEPAVAEPPQEGPATAPEPTQKAKPKAKAEPKAKPKAKAEPKTKPKAKAEPKPKTVKKPAKKAAERKEIVRLPKPQHERGRRKERRGVVVSNAMDKTIVVRVDTAAPHPRYKKVVRRSRKFHAHDEGNVAKPGDFVRIVETRPLSAAKRWRLAEVLEEAK